MESVMVHRLSLLLVVLTALLADDRAHAAGTPLAASQVLHAASSAPGDGFGRSVALASDFLIVGANGDDRRGLDAGAAYAFVRRFETWSFEQELVAPITARRAPQRRLDANRQTDRRRCFRR
jgi:hypothetical protein